MRASSSGEDGSNNRLLISSDQDLFQGGRSTVGWRRSRLFRSSATEWCRPVNVNRSHRRRFGSRIYDEFLVARFAAADEGVCQTSHTPNPRRLTKRAKHEKGT